MKLKRFLLDGLIEARRQLFGTPKRKQRNFKYILTLSKPIHESRIIKELIHTDLYQDFLKIEKYGYGWKG